MTDFLVVRADPTNPDFVEWLAVDQTGAHLGETERGELSATAASAGGRKVILLLPAVDVLLSFADIPIRNISKLRQALPFAMEDQVAEDISHLHFSIGARADDERLPVATVKSTLLDAWLARFTEAGLDVAAVYSEAEALGSIPNTSVMQADAKSIVLRDPNGETSFTDLNGIDALIDLWLARHKPDDEEEAPPAINLLAYLTPETQPVIEPALSELRPLIETLDIKILADGVLPRMASQIAVQPGINLLQGPYSSRTDFTVYWPVWRLAAALLAALTLIIGATKVLEIRALNARAATLDTAIEQALRYSFPEVRDIRDPRALLQSKLRGLGQSRGATSGPEFLNTLSAIAAAVEDSPDQQAKLQAINYRSGVMELRVLVPDVETLDNIQKIISKRGELQAEIQSANPEGEEVLGRLQIKAIGL